MKPYQYDNYKRPWNREEVVKVATEVLDIVLHHMCLGDIVSVDEIEPKFNRYNEQGVKYPASYLITYQMFCLKDGKFSVDIPVPSDNELEGECYTDYLKSTARYFIRNIGDNLTRDDTIEEIFRWKAKSDRNKGDEGCFD